MKKQRTYRDLFHDYQIENEGHSIELPETIEHEGKRYRIVLEEEASNAAS